MLELRSGQIDLWYLDMNSGAQLDAGERAAYAAAFNELEAMRYQRLLISSKQEQFLLGKYLLRQVLSKYRDIDPLAWRFTENTDGKPGLVAEQQGVGEERLVFNLSHSKNLFVLAVSVDRAIGVDTEYAARPRRIVELAERHFSNSEIQDLKRLPADQQLARFYQIWTLKEAYVKARGVGLTVPLQDFSMSFTTNSQIEFNSQQSDSNSECAWCFWSLALQLPESNEPYTVSIALDSAAQSHTLSHREFVSSDLQREQRVQLIAQTASPASAQSSRQ